MGRTVETIEYMQAAERFVRSAGVRCADGDEIELARLANLHAHVDAAMDVAVAGLRARGHSWAYIGAGAGMTRQAAHKRWGHLDAS